VRRLIVRFRREIHEVGKFGVIGAIAWVIDTLTFTACLSGGVNRYTAAVISTAVSATVAFIGNRYWTWRDRAGSSLHREYGLYAIFNIVGLLIGLACLFTSHELLGAWQPRIFHTQFADTVAKNGVGLLLGTAFRFWSYRRFVFSTVKPEARTPAPVIAGSGD
jgi:putative flippase GtrA